MPNAFRSLDSVVADLQKDIERLDAEHKDKKSRLLAAITALTGERPSTLNPDIVGIAKALQQARMKAVDEAIKVMPPSFTTMELRDSIVKNNPPEVVKATRGSYLPTRLTILASNKKIKLQTKGENGQPNLWMKL